MDDFPSLPHDPNLYRFVEQGVIEKLRADNEALRGEVSYMKAQIESFERKIWQHEEYIHRHDKYDYRVSVIVVTPEATRDRPIAADEVYYVGSTDEAFAKEEEIFERQNQLKRKVMIAQQSNLRNVPF